jgi:hypothetical protein
LARLLAALLTALTGLLIRLGGILSGLVIALLATLARLLALLARLFLRATLLRLRFILITHVGTPRAGSPLGQSELGIFVPDMRCCDAGDVTIRKPQSRATTKASIENR